MEMSVKMTSEQVFGLLNDLAFHRHVVVLQ
jgi:hypothetical protein